MTKQMFMTLLHESPRSEIESYLFIVDNKPLADNILACKYRSVLISSEEGYIHDTEEFIEVLSSCFGCRSDYIFVLCASRKQNEELSQYLSKEYLNYRADGWQIFKDFHKQLRAEEVTKAAIEQYISKYRIPGSESIDDFGLVSFADIKEERAEWLIDSLVPKGQITTISGTGGSGKTTLWCSIAAAVSNGSKMFLDSPFWVRDQGKVLVFSAEDSASIILKKRLRKHNANMENIFTIPLSNKRFSDIKFKSDKLSMIVEKVRPDLMIFDPFQNFVGDKIKLGDRNSVRQEVVPLMGLCEEYGTTTLIILHCNKLSGSWGRKRMADSSDIWDVSRSVLMVGETGSENVSYISQEKSNYGMLSETHLFSIEDEIIVDRGTTDLKDRDYVLLESENQKYKKPSPTLDTATDMIMEFLEDGQPKPVKELDELAAAMSISKSSLRRAKDTLKAEGKVKYIPGGGRSAEGWKIQKT